jgi:hypothetical protein
MVRRKPATACGVAVAGTCWGTTLMFGGRIISGYQKHRQEEIQAEAEPYRSWLQASLSSIQRQAAKFGAYVASAREDEIIFNCPSYEAAKALDEWIYDGRLSIQKTPIPGTDSWEVRVSE